MDLPPVILRPDAAPGAVLDLVFQGPSETLTVVAQDPEEQPLFFLWEVPRGVVATPSPPFEEEGGLTISVIQIPADPLLDQSTLTVTVFDPAGNDADLSWFLVIP